LNNNNNNNNNHYNNNLRFDVVGQGLLPNQTSNVLVECSLVNPLKSDYANAASKKPFDACQ
jgi:hypothetical protein